MRRNNMTVPTFLMSVLLAGLVSFSGVMCLRDAFSLQCQSWMLLTVCACAAVITTAAMIPKRSWPCGLVIAAVYAALLIWQRGPLGESVHYVVHRITSEYALCFAGVQVLGQPDGSAFWLLAAIGVPLAWLTAWVTCRENNSILFVVMACLPVFVLCLLVVDLAPVLWLILLVGGLMILIISHGIRERSPAEGSRLAWWLVLPTIILLSGITVLWPPADYVRADWSAALQKAAETKVKLEVWQETTLSSQPKWNRDLEKVDLSKVGPKSMSTRPVMDYRSDQPVSYLRGVSLGQYADNAWKALDSADYGYTQIQWNPMTASYAGGYTLEIETRQRQPMLYTTYYLMELPAHAAMVDDAYLQNTDRSTEYSLLFGQLRSVADPYSVLYDQYVLEQYLQVPDDLQQPLAEIAAEAGLIGASPEMVAAYVRQLGTYDLNTPRVPDGEDFVLYFLQKSQQGYCIHFATAATMLLRSVGIPARYVTGYSVAGTPGQWNSVTEEDAHAWVEYYVAGIGWLPLEPTPAAAESEEEPVPETSPDAAGEPDPPAEEPTVRPQSQPQPDADTHEERPAASDRPVRLLWLLIVPGLLALIWLRRWIGLRYRRERCAKGHPNRRALTWWRWLVQLSRAGSRQIPEELLCLAEKARYSQHTMTEAELMILQRAVEAQIAELRSEEVSRRLWHRYGLILY